MTKSNDPVTSFSRGGATVSVPIMAVLAVILFVKGEPVVAGICVVLMLAAIAVLAYGRTK